MVRSLPLLVSCACASVPLTPEVGDDPAPLAFAASPLSLDAGTPVPGEIVTLTLTGADPNETVRFWASNGGLASGAGPCPTYLGGLCLDLGSGTVVAGTITADSAGVAVLDYLVPATAVPGRKLTFQAAARRGFGGNASVASNAVVRRIPVPAWSNAVVVDGSLSEWTADELFDTTSADGSLGGVTWDADALYVAFDHPDVANGGGLHWQLVYIGTGAPGSASGATLNTQTPALPFEASHVLRRKADGSYDDLLVWDDVGASWVGTPYWLGTEGSAAAEGGEVLELAIPRAVLGSDLLDVALVQVYEGGGFESTYAGVPASAFTDGYDPDLAAALALDLTSPDAPAVQNP